VAFARAQSAQTRELFLSQTLDSSDEQRLVQACQDSVRDQQRIESSDSLPFEIYRQQYVSADRLGSPMTARG
jgi:glutamate--cysteine ligase